MLSNQLKELEVNLRVKRTVYDSTPLVLEFLMTEYGKALDKVIDELAKWAIRHGARIMGK